MYDTNEMFVADELQSIAAEQYIVLLQEGSFLSGSAWSAPQQLIFLHTELHCETHLQYIHLYIWKSPCAPLEHMQYQEP